MNEYVKLTQLPMGLDAQQNILVAGGNATGSNWIVADGNEYQKRPGFRPVFAVPAPDGLSSSYSTELRAPRGVVAAGLYLVGNQPRTAGRENLGSATGLDVYNDTQIVFIADGRLFAIRKLPVMLVDSSTTRASVGVDAATGSMQVSSTVIATGVTTAYTITETSTLTDVAAALPSISVNTFTPVWSTTRIPGYAAMPASALIHTDEFSVDVPLRQNRAFLYAYAALEMPFSNPTGNTYPYRCFYTKDRTNIDGNVQAVQFQDEMVFAGNGDTLFSFDGYRMSAAGCLELASVAAVPQAAGGSLSAGRYLYIARTKIVRPSGQITYGPPVNFSTNFDNVASDSNELTFNFSDIDLSMYGSDYSGIAKSPRRMNPFSPTVSGGTSVVLTAAQLDAIQPQVGEYISERNLQLDAVNVLITDVTGTTVSTTSGVLSGPEFSLGEQIEVYRTAANGTSYYFLNAIPAGDGLVWEDTTSDAFLQTMTLYVAKPYVIQRPPDVCTAVTVHQSRIVVVGEYLYDYDNYFEDPIDLGTTKSRPFIKNVYWSMPNNEEFNPLNNVILDVTEGGELNSVLSVNDALYVGGSESLWLVQGSLTSTANTFTTNRIAGAAGTVGNTALCALNGQVYAVSRNGLYAVNGGGADYTPGQQINALIRKLPPALLPFIRLQTIRKNSSLLLTIPGMVFERTATLTTDPTSFPGSFVATEDAADSIALCFDPNTQQWSLWSGEEMYLGGGIVNFDGQTWAFPRRDDKYISILDSNYGYDGFTQPVEMSLEGPWQSDSDIFTDKNFTRLRVLSASEHSQNFVLYTKIERNWVEDVASQEFDLAFASGQGYGETAYGESAYGDPNETSKQIALTNQKCLSVRAVFENSDPTEFPSITGWNFEVAENRKNMKQE